MADSVQFSRVRLFATPWTATHQASLPITNSRSLLKLMFIKSVMPSSHLILCHPLLLLPSIFLSIRVFSIESVVCIRWPKYWSFSFHICPSNKHPGLISFRMDWLDLLAVQGTLESLLQHHSSKASILQCSAFFIVQLSQAPLSMGLFQARILEWVAIFFSRGSSWLRDRPRVSPVVVWQGLQARRCRTSCSVSPSATTWWCPCRTRAASTSSATRVTSWRTSCTRPRGRCMC